MNGFARTSIPPQFKSLTRRPVYAEGELLVKYRTNVPLLARKQSVESRGHHVIKEFAIKRGTETVTHVKLSRGETVKSGLRKYAGDSNIEFVQPNFLYQATQVPNDPLYPQQWGYNNTGQQVTYSGGPDAVDPSNNPPASGAGDDMGLQLAWDHITDCSSVVVAVVDTGINYNQEDLAGNMWVSPSYPKHGTDFVVADNDPMDMAGHGSHVAGTIGAMGNNGLGGTGICWKAQLMAVRALDASGSGSTANIIQGIDFAVKNQARVINLSLGGSYNPTDTTDDTAFISELETAQAAGALLVVAAGNDGVSNDSGTTSETAFFPCAYSLQFPNVLCVAALDQGYNLASFSNYGPNSVQTAAPGTNIVSTWNGTLTSVADPLDTSAPWTMTSTTKTGWGFSTVNIMNSAGVTSTVNRMTDPGSSSFGSNGVNYSANTDDRTYKNFSIGKVDAALVSFLMAYSLDSQSVIAVAFNPKGGDPFASCMINAAVLDPTCLGGAVGNSVVQNTTYFFPFTYDISPCLNDTTCSIGLQLLSGAQTGEGGEVIDFDIEGLNLQTNIYNVIEGTSMATPHVTGLAALLFAYNPQYTYSDVMNAITNGGAPVAALSGMVSSGKAAHAMGALSYINPPTGVSASVQ
jgi:thermitase